MSGPEETPVRRFLRSSGIMALFYAAAMVLAFVTGIVLTRSLGAYGYGIYSLALTTATLIGLITEFGLPVLAMRETGTARASGKWGHLRGLLTWSDRAILLLSLVLIAGTYGWIVLSGRAADSDYLAVMLWAVVLLPLVGLAKLRSTVLLALDRVAAGQFAVMILRPLVFLAVCFAIPLFAGALTPAGAMIAQVLGAVASLVMVALLFRRWRPRELVEAKPERDVRGWLAASLPMGLTEGLRLLQGQLALLLTGWLAGATAAGVYRGADAVLQLATVIASVAATAATPMFARMVKEDDRAGIERIAALACLAMAGGVLGIALPIALVGDWLFPLLFGQDFAASPPVFAILAAGLFATYGMGLAQALANMSGHHVLTTQSFLVTAAINLALGLALIPAQGAIGAAIATAVSATCGAGWCAWRLWRRTGYNTSLFNPALPGIVAGSVRSGLALAKGASRGQGNGIGR
ncbi:MAG TPA: oligosaccharide flippase family protein [Novosphingobium sp.]|nr:oligosaccharide flippase family protein [Novosphingobium sp.]